LQEILHSANPRLLKFLSEYPGVSTRESKS
jgi:hypothetical protein